jgi:hypothetical protein
LTTIAAELATPALLVPQGAEERAIRRAAPNATVIATRAGAHAATLPEELPTGLIIVMGLCGALPIAGTTAAVRHPELVEGQPQDLRTGNIAIFRDVVDEVGLYAFDNELVQAMQATLPSAKLVHGCTIDHVVTRATERAALAAAYGAQAVDMEGTHVARALAARGCPSLIVRVVSDDPSFDLPPIEDAFTADGTIRPLHLARAFASRPVAAARFIRDVRRSLTVLGEVAAAITRRS